MIYQPEDRAIYDDLVGSLRKRERIRSVGELMLDVGKYFLGFPYAGNTLERQGREALVINLRAFDCFTLVENCIALASVMRKGEVHFQDYTAQLKTIRYRRGALKGYPSRLHYFSDWLYDNGQKGILKNVTSASGGEPFRKDLHFMTRHREMYPALSPGKYYREMIAVERRLSRRIMHQIPKAASGKVRNIVEDGDLIAITAGIEGLDVMHVGLAVRVRSRVHLLHASEVEKRVVISDVTLRNYLLRRKNAAGIMIGRAIPACQSDDSPSSV